MNIVDKEAYRELVDSFLKQNKVKRHYFFNETLNDFQKSLGKTLIDFSAEEMLELLVGKGKYHIGKMNTVNSYLKRYGDFYEYLIKKGVISHNICNDALLSAEAVSTAISNETALKVFTEEDIAKISKNFYPNSVYDEAIVRSFLEGVCATARELTRVLAINVDLDRQEVKTRYGIKPISKRLAYLYGQVMHLGSFFTRNNREYRMEHMYGRLFPVNIQYSNISEQEFEDAGKRLITREVARMEEMCGERLDERDLYLSGVVKTIRLTAGSDYAFINLILSPKRAQVTRLQEILDENHYNFPAKKFRYLYRTYAIQLQKQLESKAEQTF